MAKDECPLPSFKLCIAYEPVITPQRDLATTIQHNRFSDGENLTPIMRDGCIMGCMATSLAYEGSLYAGVPDEKFTRYPGRMIN